jgi:hypothetical protein
MTFVSHWSEISTALGLEIQSPAEVTLPDGRIVNAPVLLKNFGYENGMMLFEGAPGGIWEAGKALVALGYGYSCLGPYRENEVVDLEVAKEILADWTWSGPPSQRPAWLTEPPPDAPNL